MSKPKNGAARNTMSPMERQCYDWGWADAEERIVKLLQKELSKISSNYDVTFKRNGEYLAEYLTELIKGEQK